MFCVELGVKMFVTWRHFACLDRGDLRFAQLGRALDATVALRQAHEILVGHQHGPRTAVLGDDYRRAYGGVLIGAEVLGNFGGGDGRAHDAVSFVPEYTENPGIPQVSLPGVLQGRTRASVMTPPRTGLPDESRTAIRPDGSPQGAQRVRPLGCDAGTALALPRQAQSFLRTAHGPCSDLPPSRPEGPAGPG